MVEEIYVKIAAQEVFTLWGIPITNTLITSWVVMIVLIALALLLRRQIAMVPGLVQAAVESVFEPALDYMASVLEHRRLAERLFPFLMTLFLFILVANWIKFVPGIGSIVVEHAGHSVPLLRTVTTDLNVTLALALIAFFVIEAVGIASIGALRYAGKFVNFTSPLAFLIGIVELISEFVRIIAFSFRLFGNIFAGKVLILVVTFFVPFVMPVPVMAFEVLVGFIQAAIFAILTLFFIKLAITDPHEGHEH